METVSDARQEFSDRLKSIMKGKGIFSEEPHVYLTDLMSHYVAWENGDLAPSIHTRDTRPFVFQINGIGEDAEIALNQYAWYEKIRSIGETLLVAVGYWPESISPTPTRERPSLEYYASIGSTAYSRAYRMRGNDILKEMSKGFRKYANTLHCLRNDIGDTPIKNIDVIIAVTDFFEDDSSFRRYLIGDKIRIIDPDSVN